MPFLVWNRQCGIGSLFSGFALSWANGCRRRRNSADAVNRATMTDMVGLTSRSCCPCCPEEHEVE